MITEPEDEDFLKEVQQWENPQQATLPLFHKCMEEKNFISIDDIKKIGRVTGQMPNEHYLEVSEIVSIGTFYQHFSFHPMGKHVIRVCLTTPCLLNGARKLLKAFSDHLGIGLEETSSDGLFSLQQSQCMGQCADSPCFMIDEDTHIKVSPDQIPALLEPYRKNLTCQPAHVLGKPMLNEPTIFSGLTSERTISFEDYRAKGGYQAFERVLRSMSPEAVLSEIERSGLSGRGGAAFSTSRKYQSVRAQSKPRYLICNADEGEPGTFKDRYIMERDPHLLLEGMLISAYTMGTETGYIYIRSEYPHSYRILEKAIIDAEENGLIGDRILGADFSFRIRLYRGAGAYICGEETSLIESLEGKRGFPRNKPPHVSEKGIWQNPTDVSNVETLANIPVILEKGGEWFSRQGDARTPGTKLFCLSGRVRRPGLYEIPFGKTLRELIYDLGGGIPDDLDLKAVLPAGHVSKLLLPHQIDLSLDYPTLKEVGTFLGSASVIVIDKSVCMVDLAYWISAFFHHESCGQCTPCREGTEDMYEIMVKIVQGEGQEEHLHYLKVLGDYMVEASICGLGITAPNIPLDSIEKFAEEWKEHIIEKRCSLGICPMGKEVPLAFPPRRSRGFFDDLAGLNPTDP
ncbi:MAG: NAD(P)H-dependent oxidoreductase subunit E [Nitrospiraceae bacterium]|nr:NAD(P)H-dependent oxidoreductase subunit E [Nitrospiraceae bacterium]